MAEKNIQYWKDTITAEITLREHYRNRCEEISQKYADQERTDVGVYEDWYSNANFNILWANIQTLLAALYSRDPKPDVRRRHRDENKVAKDLAIAIERVLDFIEDNSAFHPNVKRAVQSYLMGYPGVVRGRYKPYTEEDGEKIKVEVIQTPMGYATPDGRIVPDAEHDGERWIAEIPDLNVIHEEAFVEWVPGKYFHWEPAPDWSRVTWVAIEHYMSKEECKKKFPTKYEEIHYTFTESGDHQNDEGKRGTKAKIWEVLDKTDMKVCYYADQGTEFLDELEDPWELSGFWPFPEPMFPTVESLDGTPTPDYQYYKSQHDHLNNLVKRIEVLTDVLKYRGFYDSAISEEAINLEGMDDGDFQPVEGLMEKLGYDAAKISLNDFFMAMPIAEAAALLNQMHQEKELIKQEIYEITGISDIVRGSTKASETLGAQQMKAQFANLRLTNKQLNVERFCKDIFRILAELVADNFEIQTIQDMTGMEITPEMVELMENDLLRNYNINVETDSTVLQDAAEEQKNRTEALQALVTLGSNLLPLTETGIVSMETVIRMVLFGLRGMKGARELEDHLQGVLDNVMAQSQQQPMMMPEPEQPPDPMMDANVRKANAEAELAEMENDAVSSGLMELLQNAQG